MPNQQEVDISQRTITVPSIVEYYSDAQLNSEYHTKEEYQNAITKYGAIYKVITFSETKDVNLLKQYAREWIRRNYFDGVLSFTIKAVDLHVLGYNKNKFLCGDRVPVEFISNADTRVTKTYTCLSAQYDLLKPENSSFKIGIPEVSANTKYRESITQKKASNTGTTTDPNALMEKLKNGLRALIVTTTEDHGIEQGDPEVIVND